MARNLYRVYLYFVSLVMLVFAAVGAFMLLSNLLAQTALRGSYAPVPTQQEVVQQVVFAVVAWVIAGIVGGLHYWLIRRDMRSDPAAGKSAVRSFFLNGAEAIAALIALAAGVSALSGLGSSFPSQFDASGSVAAALIAGAVFAVLELERRRTRAAPGLATVFQRLHLFGVPLIFLVFYASNFVLSAIRETVGAVLYSAGAVPLCSANEAFSAPNAGACFMGPRLEFLWGAVVLIVGAWIGYAVLAREDTHSSLRAVTHILGFAVGAIFTVVGVERAVELVFRALLGVPVYWGDIITSYDFIAPLIFGLATALAYGLWLRRESAELPMGTETTGLVVTAISGVILAVPFWFGVGLLLNNAVESMFSAGFPPTQQDWAMSLALVVAGIAYVPIEYYLRGRSARTGNTGPRRGFVFALLAGGALTGAIGAVVMLYAIGTNLLSAPVADWQHVARIGAVALLVGVVITIVYLWQASREGFFRPAAKKPELAPEAPLVAPAVPDSLEGVLDAFAAGTITQEAAIKRIHEIEHQQPVAMS